MLAIFKRLNFFDDSPYLIEKSEKSSLLGPQSKCYFWMKPFFKSIHRFRRLHRLARVEFGNDWPDFKYGDFWEVDDVWLRP